MSADPRLVSPRRFALSLALGLILAPAGLGAGYWLASGDWTLLALGQSVVAMLVLAGLFGWVVWLPLAVGMVVPGWWLFRATVRRVPGLRTPLAAVLGAAAAGLGALVLCLPVWLAIGIAPRHLAGIAVLPLVAAPGGLIAPALIYAVPQAGRRPQGRG